MTDHRLASAVRAPTSTRRGARGFTAMETLVVLALLGMMLLLSIPALMDFFRAMKVRTGAQRLVSHMRLCRQIAVTRRARVAMVLEGGSLDPTYRAWEEEAPYDFDKASDEPWVIRPHAHLKQDRVWLTEAYDDPTTPGAGHDETFTSVLEDDTLRLWFYPNGQVLRVTGADPISTVQTDTLIRTRLRGRVNADRCDEWEVSFNRPGKVEADWKKLEDGAVPDDCPVNRG